MNFTHNALRCLVSFHNFTPRLLCVNTATPLLILSDLLEVCNIKFSIALESSLSPESHDSFCIIVHVFRDISSIVSFCLSVVLSVWDWQLVSIMAGKPI